MNLGNAFRQVREENNISRPELAKMLGCTASSLSKIERGKVAPKHCTIEALCHATVTPIARFYTLAFEPADFRIDV